MSFSLSSTQVAVENLKSYYCHWSLRAMVPTSSSPGFEGSNAVLPSGERYSPIIVPPGGQRGRSSFSSRGRTDRVFPALLQGRMIVFFLPCARGERESFLCLSPLEEEICRGHSSPGFSLDVLSSLALSFLPTQLSPAHTAVSVLRFTALLTSPTRAKREKSQFSKNV